MWRKILFFGGVLAPLMVANATDWTWSNPVGSVKLFGSGALATTLATNVEVEGVGGSDGMNYLDSFSVPAVCQTLVNVNGSSLQANARLSVDDGEVGNLIATGAIDFSASGKGGVGSGAVQLSYLIFLPTDADIFLSGIRSSVAADPGNRFTLSLFASDAAGNRAGGSLLSYEGNNFDQETSFQATQGYYLLQMDASAQVTAGAATNVTSFSFALDLTPATAVPEPAVTGLFLLGGVLLTIRLRGRVRRRG